VVLPFRLREAIQRLNPSIPTAAREDALQQVVDIGIPALMPANYLSHDKVEVFDRHEDQKEGLHVVVGDADVQINKDLSGNPSARRHGLKIYFSCEQCDAAPVLTVSQHKGQTHIDMQIASQAT
jgi:hypothetical protein